MTSIKTKVLTYAIANPAAKPRHIAAATGLKVKQVENVMANYRLTLRQLDQIDKGTT